MPVNSNIHNNWYPNHIINETSQLHNNHKLIAFMHFLSNLYYIDIISKALHAIRDVKSLIYLDEKKYACDCYRVREDPSQQS